MYGQLLPAARPCAPLLGTGGLCRETPPFRVNAAAARGSQATRSRVLRRAREGRTRGSGVSVRPNGPGGRRHHAGFSNTLIEKRDFQKMTTKYKKSLQRGLPTKTLRPLIPHPGEAPTETHTAQRHTEHREMCANRVCGRQIRGT